MWQYLAAVTKGCVNGWLQSLNPSPLLQDLLSWSLFAGSKEAETQCRRFGECISQCVPWSWAWFAAFALLPCPCVLGFAVAELFSLPAVGQVREGRVLPGCCRVLHWVWECIGEKCSGIQVPVPYVFRNCGINQVSFAGLLQVGGGSSRFRALRLCPQILRSVVIPSNTGAVTSLLQLLGFKGFPGRLRWFLLRLKSLHKEQNYSGYCCVHALFGAERCS